MGTPPPSNIPTREKATPARWQRIKSILADALAIREPDKRNAFVKQASFSDTRLRHEVEHYLQQTTAVFEDCADNVMAQSSVTGRRIGPYQIVREIGRGGMGAVYLAERADGIFDKQAALKLLKRGTDTDEILRRFGSERRILARLEHANIARLLDGGTTDDGLPYFVMDYVDGKPITKYADEHQLPVIERLKLFRVVCAAVSYAHQNLIIHRDIKPGNVLVTDKAEVKLLDFGIAKIVQEEGSELEEVTLTKLRILTPEYASPEQVKGEPVTTVSDVYALGVLLYELLTGSRPYKLKHRSADEITKAICDQEPERPSTSVTTESEIIDGADKVRRQLRGDLDNIILKALRKEPQRRYISVDQFSEDIRRHLEGLPVRARKETPAYRASKFIQRHKLGVASAVLLLLAVLGGIAATLQQAQVARAQRVIAEERFNEVREMAHSVMFDYNDALLTVAGATAVRQRMVKDSLKYLDKLAQRAGDDRALQREIASAYLKMGDVQGMPLYANLGDTPGAMESYRKSLVIRQKLAALDANKPDLQRELAESYMRVAILSQLLGDPIGAVEDQRIAIAIYEQLVLKEPANKLWRRELAQSYGRLGITLGATSIASLGDTKESLKYHRKSLAMYEALVAEEPTTLHRGGAAIEYSYIAQLFCDSGNQNEGLDNYRKSLDLHLALAKENPTDAFLEREVAINYDNIATILTLIGDNAGALENTRQALPICISLVTADPNDANIRKDLAITHRKMAEPLGKLGDRAGALEHFHTALGILDELSRKDPTDTHLRRHQGMAYLKLSEFLSDSGKVAEAIDNVQETIRINEALIAINPKNTLAINSLPLGYNQLGKCHTLLATAGNSGTDKRMDHWRQAKDCYKKSLDIWRAMKREGTLPALDAAKQDEAAREIARCDEALK